MQQNTYDSREKDNTVLEALTTNREKKSKKKLYTKQHKKERTEQDRKRDQKNLTAAFAMHQMETYPQMPSPSAKSVSLNACGVVSAVL